MNYEQRLDAVVCCAWESWILNGLDIDEDMRAQTVKTVQDAAANVYADGMTDSEWLKAVLARLQK
jgi:hypothetical protein